MMKPITHTCLVKTLVAGLLFCPAVRAASIDISSAPSLPAPNLVKNPGMNEASRGKPLYWRFGTAMPENFKTGWQTEGRSGHCLWVKAESGKMSGYWSQSLAVTPGMTYLFSAYYRLLGGRILCYAHSKKRFEDGRSAVINERFYAGTLRDHWLVPVFLPPDALMGPDPNKWHPFKLRVKVPEGLNAVTLSLGIYFTRGEVFFDDAWFGPATAHLRVSVRAGQGEQLQRVVVQRSGTEKAVFDSKQLGGGRTRSFHCSLPAQPADAHYRVEVTLVGGKVVSASYPREQGGEDR